MKYKVYIIDEVHMLSIGAFNALLKTLEEPPSYAVFIFATTELHKIPATILSRCQKYELKRIQMIDIENLLAQICKTSGFEYEKEALAQIASLSEGAARDALSILDQCFAVNEDKNITLEVLTGVLGLVTEDLIFEMIHGIHLQDSKKVLNLLNEIIGQGKDLKRFLNQMIEYMRYMMLSKVSEDLSTLIAMPEEKILYFKEQSSALSLVMIMRSIDILTQIEIDTKWSSNSRVILEIGLIKIMQPDLEKSIESLTHRVEMLEQNKALVSATPIIRNTEKKAEEKIEKPSKTLSDPIVEKPYADPLKGDLDSYEDLWEDVLEEVKAVKIATHALLIDGKFKGVIDGALCVAYGDGYGFHMIAIEKVENKKIVETAIEKVYKEPYPIKYITEVDEISTKDPNNHDDLYDFLGNHKNKLEFEE